MSAQDRQRPLPWAEVALAPLEQDDLELVHGWQNAPAVRDLTMGFRYPIQKDTVRDWIAGLSAGAPRRAVYAIRHRDEAVGIVHLDEMVPHQRRASLGVFVAAPDRRKSGIGHVATALILDYGFNGLDLRKVGLEVLATNAGAIALYERLGFVREGVKRQEYFADGVCHDSCVYGLLRAEFAALPAAAQRLCLGLGRSDGTA